MEKKGALIAEGDTSLFITLGGFAIALIIPFFLFPNIATKIVFLTIVVVFNRATPFYDMMKVEIHSVLIVVASSFFGPLPGIYTAIVSTFFVHPFGKYMGVSPWPHFVVFDTIYLIAISYFASKIPVAELATWGFILIVIGQIVLRSIRMFFFMDPISRAIGLVTINLLFNYFVIIYLMPLFLKFFA